MLHYHVTELCCTATWPSCVALPRDRVVLDCHVTGRRPVGVRSHCVHKCNVNGLLSIVTVTRISTTDLLLLITIDCYQSLSIAVDRRHHTLLHGFFSRSFILTSKREVIWSVAALLFYTRCSSLSSRNMQHVLQSPILYIHAKCWLLYIMTRRFLLHPFPFIIHCPFEADCALKCKVHNNTCTSDKNTLCGAWYQRLNYLTDFYWIRYGRSLQEVVKQARVSWKLA